MWTRNGFITFLCTFSIFRIVMVVVVVAVVCSERIHGIIKMVEVKGVVCVMT